MMIMKLQQSVSIVRRIRIRVDKNHDFFKKSKKSDFFDLNQIFLIFMIF